jgi:FHS family glucose/mannose:H+ symporter-like MFS transporter
MNSSETNRRASFAAACLGMLMFGMVLISLGSTLPELITRFNLNNLDRGTLATLLPFGILAGSIIFGPIVDRYGYKSLLILCAIIVMLGFEGIAFAQTLFLVQVCIFLIGFGGGVLNGGTNALVADISTGSRGADLSILGVFFGIGALGMPLVLGALSKTLSQQTIIATLGVLMILPIVYFVCVKFPSPKQPQGFPLKQGVRMVKDPTLMLFAMMLFFQSGLEGITNDWSAQYLIETIKVPRERALYALTSFVVGLTVTRLLLGTILRRVSPTRVLSISLGISVAGALHLLDPASYHAAIFGLILLGIGFAAAFPVILGMIGDLYSNASGTAFSIAFVLALIGNMIINKIMGYAAHEYGIKVFAVLILTALAFLSLLLVAATRRVAKTGARVTRPYEPEIIQK